MFICCNIITPSFINNKSIPVLRFIPEMKGKNYKSFDRVFYFDVIVKHLDKIQIYILSEGDIDSFEKETLHCTLHLREKSLENEVYKSDRGQ